MDHKARKRLMTEVSSQELLGCEIAVPLDLFFVGNDDQSSIGCNLGSRQPTVAEFYKTLSILRNRIEVDDIWVRVCGAEKDAWPYTDTVYVISSLTLEAIKCALKDLSFDSASFGWLYGKPPIIQEPSRGYSPCSVWWD